jgi:hypothetical protein
MKWAGGYGTHSGDERYIRGFVGENREKETYLKTQEYVERKY